MGYRVTFEMADVPLVQATMQVDQHYRLNFDEPELLLDTQENQFLVDAWESVFQPVIPDKGAEVHDFELTEAHVQRPEQHDVMPVIYRAMCMFSNCHKLFHGYAEPRETALRYMHGETALRYLIRFNGDKPVQAYFQGELVAEFTYHFRLRREGLN